MYYTKHGRKKLWIEADNIFTMCPRCGKEIPIDLSDMVIDGALDLYGTSVFCEKCGKKVRWDSKKIFFIVSRHPQN